MNNSHFSQCVGDNHRDKRGEKIADDHTGSSETNGDATPKEEPYSDGTADGQHTELPLRQRASQLASRMRSRCVAGVRRRTGMLRISHSGLNDGVRWRTDGSLLACCSARGKREPRHPGRAGQAAQSALAHTYGRRGRQFRHRPYPR